MANPGKEFHMSNESRRDDLFGAVAVCTLVIGTATGNALAMLVISAAALVAMAVFGRERLTSGALLAALVAAVTAAVLSVVSTIW
jgi:hypothetical protein